jgi:GNAT superfamily N-acetyltransferase
MAVSEPYQGRGVGRMLIEALIAAARLKDAGGCFWRRTAGMAPAIHLYERMGFVHLPKGATPFSGVRRTVTPVEMLL